jgi:hypothetical protein
MTFTTPKGNIELWRVGNIFHVRYVQSLAAGETFDDNYVLGLMVNQAVGGQFYEEVAIPGAVYNPAAPAMVVDFTHQFTVPAPFVPVDARGVQVHVQVSREGSGFDATGAYGATFQVWDTTDALNNQLAAANFTIQSLQQQLANANATIVQLQNQISNSVMGYVALHRAGNYTIKNFKKLNVLSFASGKYQQRDLDFVNIQTLSLLQAAAKCRAIALLPSPSVVFQQQGAKHEMYATPVQPDFQNWANEVARVIEFCADEVRNLQKFSLSNIEQGKSL